MSRSRGRSFWQDDEKTIIQFDKFCVVQTLRSRLISLCRRPKFKGVHNLAPASEIEVPAYVLQHIAKGGKFIPTAKQTSVQHLKSGLQHLHRKLLLGAFFQNANSDCLKPSRCKLQSSWVPPPDQRIAQFMRLLTDGLDSFEPQRFSSNFSWADRKARQWLTRHSAIVSVVDCDKGLGEAIVSRKWLQDQIRKQLAQGYVQCTPEMFQIQLSESKAGALALVEFFFYSQVITASLRRYLLHRFQNSCAGIFRVLVKVHKEPVGSRPVCNLRSSWFAPFATFLVEQLLPLQKNHPSIISSTDELLVLLGQLECKENMQLITLDVNNLYPSICRSHMLSLLIPLIRASFTCQQFATFLIKVLDLVLSVVFVEFEGELYRSLEGVPTGLSVAGVLANLYLSHLDLFLQDSLGEQLQLVVRYIDDLLLVCQPAAEDVQALADSWHPSLTFQISGVGEVNFLDICLRIDADRSLFWSMYHKPKNLYLYIPAASNHPPGCFLSLQIGGIVRCMRRNKSQRDVCKHIELFKTRLKDRGFSLKAFECLRTRFSLRTRESTNLRSSSVFLKVPYNKDINVKWLKSQLLRHLPLLQQSVPNCAVRPCWSVRKSLFRQRYREVWKKFGSTGIG